MSFIDWKSFNELWWPGFNCIQWDIASFSIHFFDSILSFHQCKLRSIHKFCFPLRRNIIINFLNFLFLFWNFINFVKVFFAIIVDDVIVLFFTLLHKWCLLLGCSTKNGLGFKRMIAFITYVFVYLLKCGQHLIGVSLGCI